MSKNLLLVSVGVVFVSSIIFSDILMEGRWMEGYDKVL